MATSFFPLQVYGDFSDAQGHLTPQSVVGSGRIRTLPSSHACHHHQYEKGRIKTAEKIGNTVFFFIITLSVAKETSSRFWPNFKLIQALMYVIVTCKYAMDSIKNSREKDATPFSHYKSMGIFFQTLIGS